MRIYCALLMLFTPFISAKNDSLPVLENVIAVKLEVSCQRPYVATAHFYNRLGEPLRFSRVYVDPAGYWNDYYFNIVIGKHLAKSKMINSLHYQSRVLEDISVVLPEGGVIKSIINLEQHYIIPGEGFDRVTYSAIWHPVALADGSTRSVNVKSDTFKFEENCIKEQVQ